MEPGGPGECTGEDRGNALRSFQDRRPDDEGRRAERAPLFGAFDVRLDGWDVDYGGEVRADFATMSAEEESVDLDVEHDAAGWAPITPAPPPDEQRIVFIDGVRRLDARVLARRGDAMCYGAFGSYGAGAVVADPGEPARFAGAIVGRRLIFGSGQSPEASVSLGASLEYLPLATPDPEPDGPLEALQVVMRQAEAVLSRDAGSWGPNSGRGAALVICDGPLQELSGADTSEDALRATTAERRKPAALVGLIKRVFKLYLPLTHRGVLRELGLGQRTPVFCIGAADARARYSWFLRLGTPTVAESDLTGLVRMEVSASCDVDVARRLADDTASRLPAFVPSRARDPRAPQNLLPIGALEQHLRHQLGDARLIRRKIAQLIASGIP